MPEATNKNASCCSSVHWKEGAPQDTVGTEISANVCILLHFSSAHSVCSLICLLQKEEMTNVREISSPKWIPSYTDAKAMAILH